MAAGVALVSALSFGELASRLPFSAGESRYVHEAFHRKWLSTLVGWAVISTGIVSASTLTRAFVGFLQDVVAVPTVISIIAFVVFMTLVAVRGILASVWLTAIITAIEVGGLIWVLIANGQYLGRLPGRIDELTPGFSFEAWSGISVAAFVSFYAFIGFEDMVNEAEEARNPRRNLPLGIIWALIITSVLYLLISLTAVLAFPPQKLAETRTPLALLVSRHGQAASATMTYISLLAGVNGALVQLIMASRVAYGMADQRLVPQFLAKVRPTYQTPIRATLLVSGLILVFALWLPLESLVKIASTIMLANFAVVNASLVRIKLRGDKVSDTITTYPIGFPILGCFLCLLFLSLQLFAQPG